jgi:quinol monooxygenase YgiN
MLSPSHARGKEGMIMFMQLLQVKAKKEEMDSLRRFYEEKVVTALQETPGCLYACLMQSAQEPDEVISMTLWDLQQSTEEHEKSGLFQRLVEEARPLFAESTEWHIQLSKEFRVEYSPATTFALRGSASLPVSVCSNAAGNCSC